MGATMTGNRSAKVGTLDIQQVMADARNLGIFTFHIVLFIHYLLYVLKGSDTFTVIPGLLEVYLQ